MSDRMKKVFGFCLLIFCLAACFIPLFLSVNHAAMVFHGTEENQYALHDIQTEHNGMVNVNTANGEQLQTLPGIGQKYSLRIISEREKNGPYYYPEDLESVSGIGPQTLRKFRPMIDMRLSEGEN